MATAFLMNWSVFHSEMGCPTPNPWARNMDSKMHELFTQWYTCPGFLLIESWHHFDQTWASYIWCLSILCCWPSTSRIPYHIIIISPICPPGRTLGWWLLLDGFTSWVFEAKFPMTISRSWLRKWWTQCFTCSRFMALKSLFVLTLLKAWPKQRTHPRPRFHPAQSALLPVALALAAALLRRCCHMSSSSFRWAVRHQMSGHVFRCGYSWGEIQKHHNDLIYPCNIWRSIRVPWHGPCHGMRLQVATRPYVFMSVPGC